MGYPVESVPEIMRRTKANLDFIKSERIKLQGLNQDVDAHGPFDVTQLVNSFMGAFAHPFEALFKAQLPSKRYQEDLSTLFAALSENAQFEGVQPELEELLGYVRNAFAHGNIEFIGGWVDEPGRRRRQDIVAVRIWNCRNDGPKVAGMQPQKKTWQNTFTVGALESILLAFVDAMSRVAPSHFEREIDCPPKPTKDLRTQALANGPD